MKDANAPEDANGERPKKNERGLLKPNTGNGANLEHYSWTQSLKDLDVRIPLHVSFKVRAKDVAVELRKDVCFCVSWPVCTHDDS